MKQLSFNCLASALVWPESRRYVDEMTVLQLASVCSIGVA